MEWGLKSAAKREVGILRPTEHKKRRIFDNFCIDFHYIIKQNQPPPRLFKIFLDKRSVGWSVVRWLVGLGWLPDSAGHEALEPSIQEPSPPAQLLGLSDAWVCLAGRAQVFGETIVTHLLLRGGIIFTAYITSVQHGRSWVANEHQILGRNADFVNPGLVFLA